MITTNDADRLAAVCRALGWEPEIEWGASRDHGESWCVWSDRLNGPFYSKREIEEWIADITRKYPNGPYANCECLKIETYPDLRTNDALAVRALEALRNGMWIESVCYKDAWGCKMTGRPKTYYGPTLGAALFDLIWEELVKKEEG